MEESFKVKGGLFDVISAAVMFILVMWFANVNIYLKIILDILFTYLALGTGIRSLVFFSDHIIMEQPLIGVRKKILFNEITEVVVATDTTGYVINVKLTKRIFWWKFFNFETNLPEKVEFLKEHFRQHDVKVKDSPFDK